MLTLVQLIQILGQNRPIKLIKDIDFSYQF